jgi:uncharacterized protein (TIGR00369 family)
MADKSLNPEYVEIIRKALNNCPYFSLLSIEIKNIQWGSSLLEMKIEEKHLQPFGAVHGGAIASLIDAAAFWASFPQVENGKGLTTVEVKVNYLAPVQNGRLIAIGKCIKMGKTIGLGEVDVKDERDRLVAHGTATMMVVPNLPIKGYEKLPPKN